MTTAVCIWPEGNKERVILKEQDSGIFFGTQKRLNKENKTAVRKKRWFEASV